MSVKTRLQRLERSLPAHYCACSYTDEQIIEDLVLSRDPPETCSVCGGRILGVRFEREAEHEH